MGYKAKVHRLRHRRPAPKRPPPEGLSLADLAARVGLSPRAIRHYLELGLLPRPEFRSSRTRYGRDHLARVYAIQALLHDGFDLAAIGRRFASITAVELEAYLPPPAPAAAPSPAEIAVDPPAPNAEAPWHHVPLLPGLALHLRADASPAVRAIAAAFIAQCVGGAREPPHRT